MSAPCQEAVNASNNAAHDAYQRRLCLLEAGADNVAAVEEIFIALLFECCQFCIELCEFGLFVRSREALIVLNFDTLAE
jgi:hypothetical protein